MSTVATPYFATSSVGKAESSLPAPPTRYDPPPPKQATAYQYYDPYASASHPTNASLVAYPMQLPYNVMHLERENERLRNEKYAKLEEENRCLREEIKRIRAENERLAAQNNEFLQKQKQEQEKQRNESAKATTTMAATSPEVTESGKSSNSGPSRGKQMVGGAAKGAARGVVMGAVAGAVVGKPGKFAEMGAATGAAGGAMNGLLFGGGRGRRY